MTRRLRLGAALVGIAVVVAAAMVLRGPRHDGPLKTNSSVTISYSLADDEVFVWGMNLPWYGDRAVGDIRIDSIEPVGTRGLEVLGLVLNNSVLQPDGTCLSYGDRPAASFPPPEVPTREVTGAVLSAADGKRCSNDPSVLVGVRWLPNSSAGRIDALRMLYRNEGVAYELVMPYSLDICRGEPDAQGRRVPCRGFHSPTP
jgi:hypothetical protein